MTAPRTNIDGWMGAIVLAVMGGLIGSRQNLPPASGRPAGVEAVQRAAAAAAIPATETKTDPSSLVPVRGWEDPLGAARACFPDPAKAPTSLPQDTKVTSALIVPVDENTTADDIEARMGSRAATSAALHRLGLSPTKSSLQVVRFPGAGSIVLGAAQVWEPDPTVGAKSAASGHCLVAYVDQRALDVGGGKTIAGVKSLLKPLGVVGPRVKNVILLRSGSSAFRSDALEIVDGTFEWTDGEPLITIVNTSSTADLRILFAAELFQTVTVTDPEHRSPLEQCVIENRFEIKDHVSLRRVLDSDALLFDQLVKELRLRGIDPTDVHNAVAVIHERDSEWGRALPISLAKALAPPPPDDKPSGHAVRLPRNMIPISYLSAIDAEPRSSPKIKFLETRTTTATSSSNQAPAPSVTSGGEKQLDHIFRSLRDLQTALSIHKSGRLRAVFIGAGDRWDVRPVVQMIRQHFPDVLILTTDLYAQYADPLDFPVMKNMVVATHLGLSCGQILQGEVPPFRSCYHTAQFVGILQGFASIVGAKPVSDCLIATAPQPEESSGVALTELLQGTQRPQGRLFEISRDGATCLGNANGAGQAVSDDLYYPEEQIPPLLRMTQRGVNYWVVAVPMGFGALFVILAVMSRSHRWLTNPTLARWSGHVLVTVAISATCGTLLYTNVFRDSGTMPWFMLTSYSIAILAAYICWTWRYQEGAGYPPPEKTGPTPEESDPWRSIHRWGCSFLGGAWILAGMFLLLMTFGSGQSSGGEPFAWANGISIWSSEVIRVVAICIGLMFLYRIATASERTAEASARKANAPWIWSRAALKEAIRSFSIIDWRPPLVGPTCKLVSAGTLRDELSVKLRWRQRSLRIFLVAAPFAMVLGLLMYVLWPSMHNVRGPVARVVDRTIVILLVVVLNAVVFVVWDEARLYTRFARNLSEAQSAWPELDVRKACKKTGFDRSLISSWLDVSFIADGTARVNRLIYWPVAIILLSILALHPRFDAWPLRWPTFLMFGLSLSIAVYAGFMLRRAAEHARDVELDRLSVWINRPDAFVSPQPADDSTQQIVEIKRMLVPLKRPASAHDFEVRVSINGMDIPIDTADAHRLADRWSSADMKETSDTKKFSWDGEEIDLDSGKDKHGAVMTKADRAMVIKASITARKDFYDNWSKSRSEQMARLRERIQGLRKGAFAPWSEDAIFRAIGLPLIGFASVQLLDWMNALLAR